MGQAHGRTSLPKTLRFSSCAPLAHWVRSDIFSCRAWFPLDFAQKCPDLQYINVFSKKLLFPLHRSGLAHGAIAALLRPVLDWPSLREIEELA
jgi:hypothetical protein